MSVDSPPAANILRYYLALFIDIIYTNSEEHDFSGTFTGSRKYTRVLQGGTTAIH